jgi:tetratricopeptide (TPR) repeat protein
MQQYRFNFPLFIGLVIGTLVCSASVYGLWKFQINRKAGWLLSEAEKAEKANDYKEASRYYGQYLTIHPKNEEIRIKLAQVMADLMQSDDVAPTDVGEALRILESTVRMSSMADNADARKLRRRLAEVYGREDFGRYQDALEHLSYLDAEDPELQGLRATYLSRAGDYTKATPIFYKLVGYDPESDEFDASKATAPGNILLYTNLAASLRTRQDQPQLADRVMDQLVEANPKSAEAYLARGRYQLSIENIDEARADIDEAYKLKPQDANVLLAKSEMASKDEQFDKAEEYLSAAKKLFPTDVRFYRTSAAVLMQQKEFTKAIAEIDEGIKQVKENDKVQLLVYKVELQLTQNDIEATEQTVNDMERTAKNIRPEFVEYYRARIMMAENKWPQAKEALSKLHPKMADMTGGHTIDIDAYLGLCYEKLHQPDMAKKYYDSVIAQSPDYPPAKAGLERVKGMLGLNAAKEPKDDEWTALYNETMKKPKAERDFKPLEVLMAKLAEENKWDDLTKKIRQAQLKAMADDFESARKLFLEAQKLAPENITVPRMLIQLVRQDPKLGPEKALQLQERTVAKFGDLPALRLDKADCLIALHAKEPNKDELKSELAALATGIDNWTDAQKAELWGGMAGRFLNLQMNDEARQFLTLAADVRPNDLPLRVSLFSLALEANDDAGMKDAQDRILKIVGSTEDNTWLFTEARRKLSLIARGQLDRKAIDEIRPLVSRALDQREEWHELHVLNAELELHAGNLAKALESFDRAEQLGRPYPAAIAQHIKLLSLAGRLQQAGELLERLPEQLRYPLLGQLYPEILFRTNRVDEALQEARDAVEANPTNPQNHYWYSQLLARSSQAPKASEQQRKQGLDAAIKEMRQALELQAEFPEAWLSLISYYGLLKDNEQAQAVLREAQLSLSGDNLQAFLARSYESLGRWFDAETMYRALYESAPNDLPRTQQLAAFYLGNAYPLPDKNLKATPLINKILRAGAEKKIQANDPGLLWARRMGARMLAESGDYQNLRKAEKMLASNSQNGELTIEDKLAMAELLANRPEPESRQKAIQLLEDVAKVQPLNETGEVMLGDLYFRTGADWPKYAAQMRKAIGLFPNSLAARVPFLKNLLDRGDKESLDEATRLVRRMNEIAPNHGATFQYTALWANKTGKQDAARANLMKSVPNLANIKTLTAPERQQLGMLAGLFIELGDLDTAESIYRKIAEIEPGQNLGLANFLGNHRSVEACFEKLNEVYSPERIPLIAQVGLVVVRKQRQKVGDKFDAQIQTWLDTGLRENPDSITLLMDQADLYDIQKRYDDAAAVYQKLLQRKDLTGIRRAIVLNNLSFLVALAGSSQKVKVDPLKLVEEAKDIMGPNADILDTRAVVFISLGKYQQAIEDLELSVLDNPTASKYFHKAQAHLKAQQDVAAVQAWEKAESLGLNHDAINLMEIPLFDDLKAKIDQIRGASVTKAESLRPAG